MKNFYFLLAVVLFSSKLMAQNTPGGSRPVPPPLPQREVSGVVKDTSDNTVAGALVTLTSTKDTLKTITNADGIFVFKNVKMATFFLTVSSLGFRAITVKRLENDAIPRLVLGPILLKEESKQLADIVINGTPSVVYKTDTIEFKASDYKVRENATVEDLIKKMEGIEVAADGSVTSQGQSIARARLNGKDYIGGDVATVIRDLPAEIVDKIQVIDDYGSMAARTGIKEGDPQKVLNITTQRDKSVVNRGRLNAGIGTNDRYQVEGTGTRINGNQQIGLAGGWNQQPAGVNGGGAGGGGFIGRGAGGGAGRSGVGNQGVVAMGGGSGGGGGNGSIGTINSGNLSLSHADEYGDKLESDVSYNLTFGNSNTFNNSSSYSPLGTSGLSSVRSGSQNSNNATHRFSGRLEYDIDTANYLEIRPSFSYSQSTNATTSSSIQTGAFNQSNIGSQSNNTYTPNLGLNASYQHIFKNKRRNMSLGFDYTRSDNNVNNDSDEDITDIDQNGVITRTPLHRIIEDDNISTSYSGSITYTEPLGKFSSLNFNTNVNKRVYDNSKITNLINGSGIPEFSPTLSNVFDYSFTTSNIVANYRYGGNGKKANYSIGIRAQPSLLEGFSETRNIAVSRERLYVVPVFRFQYQWSRVKQFSINYNGNPREPTYNQIQPVRDDTNPLSPVLGNPNLKATFNHQLNGQFGNYFPNSRITIGTTFNANLTKDKVITNRYAAIENKVNKQFTEYINADGAYSFNGGYTFSKRFPATQYAISLSGNAGFARDVAMIRGAENISETWNFSQTLATQITPVEWFEMNPTFRFFNTKRVNTLPTSLNTRTTRGTFSVDGRFIIKKSYILGYTANKSIQQGVNIAANNNPFVINSYVEKEFFKRKNGVFRIQASDVFNQDINNNRQQNADGGFSETQSNPLNRYFMFSFRWSPSRFGSSTRTQGARRGDGSFINR